MSALKCPNKSSKAWKDLVEQYGETIAYALYIKSGDNIPTLNEAISILSTQELSLDKEMNISQAISWLKSIFKDESNEFYSFIANEMGSSDKESRSRFIDGVIEIESNNGVVDKAALRHEAFHKIYNEYLSQEDRYNLYNAYYNSASDELKASLDLMSEEQMSIAVEELLAFEYQNKKDKPTESIFSTIINKIKKLIRNLLSNRKMIDNYFDLMDAGVFSVKQKEFTGERNFKGIREVFGAYHVYREIKKEITLQYSNLYNNGHPENGMQMDDNEILTYILNTLSSEYKLFCRKLAEYKKAESIIERTGKDITLDNGKVLTLDMLRAGALKIKSDPRFKMLEAIVSDPNVSKSNSIYNKVLKDIFPSKKPIRFKNSDKFEQDLEEEDESIEQQEIDDEVDDGELDSFDDILEEVEVAGKIGVEGAFEANSSKIDRESKIFDKVKQFLGAIYNDKKGRLVNPRFAFFKTFQLLEGLDPNGDFIKQIESRLSNLIVGNERLIGRLFTDERYAKRDDVVLAKRLIDAYIKSKSDSYGEHHKTKKYEEMRTDISAFYGEDGRISVLVYNKDNANKDSSKYTLNKAKADGSLIVYRRRNESTFDFVERYINAVNKESKNGLAYPIDESQDVYGIMHSVNAKNLFSEIFSTFNSMKESKLLIAEQSQDYGNRKFRYKKGSNSSKDYTFIRKFKSLLASKFNSASEFKDFLREELKTIEVLRKRKDDLSSYNISKRFLEKLGFNTSKLKPATLVGDVIDSSYTLAADDIYFFIERSLKTDENEAREGDKQIDAEESEKEGEDISFNDFMERILEDEGSFLEHMSSLFEGYGETAKSGSYRDAKGKKRYTISNTSWGNRVFNALFQMEPFTTYARKAALRGKTIMPFMKLDFFKNNIFTKGISQIYDYYQHNGIVLRNPFGEDKIIEFKGESFEAFIAREFQAGFIDQLRRYPNEPKYWQFIYVKSNRPDTEAAQVAMKPESWIIGRIFPALYEQYLSQNLDHESSVKDFKVDSFINMKALEEALKAVFGEEYKSVLRKDIANKTNSLKEALKTPESSAAFYNAINDFFDKMADSLASKMIEDGVPLDEDFIKITKKFTDAEFSSKELGQMHINNKGKLRQTKSDISNNRKEVLLPLLKLFVMNHYVNSYSLTQLATGNHNYYGNAIKETKRMSLVYAPGTSLNMNDNRVEKESKVLVMQDVTFGDEYRMERLDRLIKPHLDKEDRESWDKIKKEILDKYSDGTIDYADGMGFITPERYEQIKFGLGESYNLGVIGKPVYFSVDKDGVPRSVKYSWVVLTDKLCEGSKELSNLRDTMNANGYREAVFESAMKTGIPKGDMITFEEATSGNTEAANNKASVMIDNAHYRMQLNPMHDVEDNIVAYPSQLVYFLNILGQNVERAVKVYNATAKIILEGRKQVLSKLVSNGNIDKAKAKEVIQTKLEGGTDDNIYDMLKNGISINFPAIVQKSISQMSSYITKNTVGIKFNGGKLVLQAAVGIKRPDGKELSYNSFTIAGKNTIVADAMISRSAAKKMLSKEAFEQIESDIKNGKPARLLFANGDALGLRIPSSEMHSAVVLNIVGFHENKGNGVIVPKDVVELHGSDFDVDSLFVLFRDPVLDEDGNPIDYTYNKEAGVFEFNELSEEEISELDYEDAIKHYKNIVIEGMLDAFSDENNLKRMMTPISMSNLRDQIDRINAIRGVESASNNLDLSNILDKFKVHQSSFNGVLGTGIFALGMKSLSYLSRAGENHSSPKIELADNYVQLNIDGVKYDTLTSEPVKFEIADSLINAAIDNVKEQILPYLNLNENTIPSLLAMLSVNGLSEDFAFNMMSQPIIKIIADTKGISRDAGYNEAVFIINALLDKAGANKKFSDVTFDTFDSNILTNGILALDNMDSLRSLLSKDILSAKEIEFITEQAAVLNLFRTFRHMGDSLSSFSRMLSTLRNIPSSQIKIEEVIDTVNEVLVSNEEGVLVTKNSFPYKIDNILSSLPHLEQSLGALTDANTINENVFFKHSKIVKAFVDSVLKSNLLDLKSDSKTNHLMREELVQYLINGVQWDSKFEGYNSIKPYPVTITYRKNGKKHTVKRNLTGKDAFNNHFVDKVQAVSKWLEENGRTHVRFMNELTTSTKRDGTKEIRMPGSPEFKVEDIQELQYTFEILGQLEVVEDENGEFKVIERTDFSERYTQFQKDFVRYGVNTFGMSFGATNYSLALPSDLYKSLSDGFESIISGIASENLTNIRDRFILEFAINNPSSVRSLKKEMSPVKKGGLFNGTDDVGGDPINYDIKFNTPADESGTGLPTLIKRSSNRTDSIYVKSAEVNGYTYYQKVGTSKGSKIYNFETGMLDTKYSITNSPLFSPNVKAISVDDTSKSTFNVSQFEINGIETAKTNKNSVFVLVDYKDSTREKAVPVVVKSAANGVVKVEKVDGAPFVSDSEVKPEFVDALLNGFRYYAKYVGKAFKSSVIIKDLLLAGTDAQKAIIKRLTNDISLNPDVRFVSSEEMRDITNGKDHIAFYDSTNDVILINKDKSVIYNQKLFSEIFMHELIHAASYKRLQKLLQLEKKGLLSEADKKALDELRMAFEEAKNKVGDAYAFENLHEFISETLSNSGFQMALKREGLFTKVINFIKRMFGVKPKSILDNAMNSSFNIIEGTSEYESYNLEKAEFVPLPMADSSSRIFAGGYRVDEFSNSSQNIFKEGEYLSVEMKEVDGRDEQTEFYIDKSSGNRYRRVTYGPKSLMTSANPFFKEHQKTYAESKAEALWGDNPRSITLLSDISNKPVTFEDYIKEVDTVLNKSRGKGLILHLMNEYALATSEEERAEIRSKIRDVESSTAVDSTRYNWFLEKIDKIYKALGINFFSDSIPDDLRDKPVPEVHIKSDLLGYAGSVDLMVEHADTYSDSDGNVIGNFVSIYDFKTGNNMADKIGTFIMNHGDQIKTITNSPLDKAKLQLAFYAVIMKLENPNIRFRDLKVAYAANEYSAVVNNPNTSVEVEAFIPMVEQLLKDKEVLEELGLPLDTHARMLEKSKDVFNTGHYSHSSSYKAEDAILSGKSGRRTLKEINRSISILEQRLRLPEVANNPSELMRVRALISELLKEKHKFDTDFDGVALNIAASEDTGLVLSSLGNIKDSKNPVIQNIVKMYTIAKETFRKATMKKLSNMKKLTDDLRKEYISKRSISEMVDADYTGMYEQLLKEAEIPNVGLVQRLILETDDEWNSLSDVQKAFIKEYVSIMDSYFIGNDALANQVAVTTPNGKAYSNLEVRNALATSEKFVYYRGFFPKTRARNIDLYKKYGNGNSLAGRFSATNIKREILESVSFHDENLFDEYDNDDIAIPLKYLGNTSINSKRYYSMNLADALGQFVEWSEYKREMDDVYSYAQAVRQEMVSLGESGLHSLHGKFKHDISLIEKFSNRVIRRVNKSQGAMGENKIALGTHPITGQQIFLSPEQTMRKLNRWSSATIMWARPFGAAGNAIVGHLTTFLSALSYSWATKFLGVKMSDYKASTVLAAWKEFTAMSGRVMSGGKLENEKLWLFMDMLGMHDGEVRGWRERQTMALRERTSSGEFMMGLHTFGEMSISMTTVASVLKNMKLEDGQSMWDAYKVVDGQLVYDGPLRGVTYDSNGNREEVKDLTPMEIGRIRRIHERTQGGYKNEEMSGMEMNAFGQFVISLKKYFPRIIVNLIQSKHNDITLGEYEQVGLEKDGTPILKWTPRKGVNGKLRVLFPLMLDFFGGTAKSIAMFSTEGYRPMIKRWESLSDEEKVSLVHFMNTTMSFFMAYAIYGFMFKDNDDDDTMKKWWYTYMMMNVSQQYNPVDILNTGKSFFEPVAVTRAYKSLEAASKMFVAGVDIAINNGQDAYTQRGDLRGWVEFRKSIPYMSSYYDFASKIEKAGFIDDDTQLSDLTGLFR